MLASACLVVPCACLLRCGTDCKLVMHLGDPQGPGLSSRALCPWTLPGPGVELPVRLPGAHWSARLRLAVAVTFGQAEGVVHSGDTLDGVVQWLEVCPLVPRVPVMLLRGYWVYQGWPVSVSACCAATGAGF